MSQLAQVLEEHLARSKAQGRTMDFIRQYVVIVVDRALRDHYGPNYSIRCLQSTFGVIDVLAELGISGRAWSGAVCLAGVTTGNPFDAAWHGFWGDDHHAWAVTEHMELVDVSISQVHRHPASAGKGYEPMPPLWWSPVDVWPPIIKYLPAGVIKPQLVPDEAADLDAFRKRVKRVRVELTGTLSVDDVLNFGPMLHGPDWMNSLAKAGHPWLNKCLIFQRKRIPLPPWVVEREQELMRNSVGRKR